MITRLTLVFVVLALSICTCVYGVTLKKIGSYKDTTRTGWDNEDGTYTSGDCIDWYWAVPEGSVTGSTIQAGQRGDGSWVTYGEGGGSYVPAVGP